MSLGHEVMVFTWLIFFLNTLSVSSYVNYRNSVNTYNSLNNEFSKRFLVYFRNNFRPIEIDSSNSSCFKLKTSVKYFKYQLNESLRPLDVDVDLYSMIHVADPEYYEYIEHMMQSYDVILYELITDDENIVYEDISRQETACTYIIFLRALTTVI